MPTVNTNHLRPVFAQELRLCRCRRLLLGGGGRMPQGGSGGPMWPHACMFPRLNLNRMIQVHYRLQNYRSWATQVSMFVYINIENIDIHNRYSGKAHGRIMEKRP